MEQVEQEGQEEPKEQEDQDETEKQKETEEAQGDGGSRGRAHCGGPISAQSPPPVPQPGGSACCY